MGRRKRFTRRLARGGSASLGFLARVIVIGAAAAWLLDRRRGAERRARVLGWVRSLVGEPPARTAAATASRRAGPVAEHDAFAGVTPPAGGGGRAPREPAHGSDDDGG